MAIGIVFLALAALIILLSSGTADLESTFVLTSRRAGVTIEAPDLTMPTTITLYVLAMLVAFAARNRRVRT